MDTQEPNKENGEKKAVYNLDEYARETGLDKLWLIDEFKLKEGKDKDGSGYIRIPYFTSDGTEINYRKRYAPAESGGPARYVWGRGIKPKIYGLEQTGNYTDYPYMIITDNEVDTQSLIKMGWPVLGVFNGTNLGDELAARLEGFSYVYISANNGISSERFISEINQNLLAHKFKGEIFWFSVQEYFADSINTFFQMFGVDEKLFADKLFSLLEQKNQVKKLAGRSDEHDAELRKYYLPECDVVNGRVCKPKTTNDGEVMTPLSRFVVIPVAEVIKDDGTPVESHSYRVKAYRDGKFYPEITISVDDAAKNKWDTTRWGSAGGVIPKKADDFYDAVRNAIFNWGKIEYIYTYMGIKNIGGKDVYLHSSGHIGETGETVSVELREGLEDYQFVEPTISFAEAVKADFTFLDIAKYQITIPLLAMTYLSPLIEFLDRAGCKPSFAMFLYGTTSSFKSSSTAAALWHFGSFKYNRQPGSFQDTSSGAERAMYDVKDALYVIDDFHPEGKKEAEAMNAFAERIIQGIGNNAGRNRMNKDRTVSSGFRPRCSVIMSGEYLPQLRQSALARLVGIKVSKGDISLQNVMKLERDWWKLNIAMQGYIGHILKNSGQQLLDRLSGKFIEYQTEFAGSTTYTRQASAAAWLMIGFEFFIEYAAKVGAADEAYCKALVGEARGVMLDLIEENNVLIVNGNPAKIYIRTVMEMLAAGDCYVKKPVSILDESGIVKIIYETPAMPLKQCIGYEDDKYYYLIPGVAYKAVSDFYRGNFTVADLSIRQQLRTDGLILPDKTNSNLTRLKRFEGKTPERFIWVIKAKIDFYLSDEFIEESTEEI